MNVQTANATRFMYRHLDGHKSLMMKYALALEEAGDLDGADKVLSHLIDVEEHEKRIVKQYVGKSKCCGIKQ